jgi:hypothetical protein
MINQMQIMAWLHHALSFKPKTRDMNTHEERMSRRAAA